MVVMVVCRGIRVPVAIWGLGCMSVDVRSVVTGVVLRSVLEVLRRRVFMGWRLRTSWSSRSRLVLVLVPLSRCMGRRGTGRDCVSSTRSPA